MFVKQIDEKTALELAAKGKEVLVMVPGGKDSGWEDMRPDSLGHMLEGCMFFRKEPAMEAELMELTVEPAGRTIEFGPAEEENAQQDPSHQPEENEEDNWRWKEKLIALHNAGWSVAKIADELGISTRTVYAHLQKMREEGKSHEENTDNAGTGIGT